MSLEAHSIAVEYYTDKSKRYHPQQKQKLGYNLPTMMLVQGQTKEEQAINWVLSRFEVRLPKNVIGLQNLIKIFSKLLTRD